MRRSRPHTFLWRRHRLRRRSRSQGPRPRCVERNEGFDGERRSRESVGDPRVRLSHRENAGDYPPYKLKLSTYIVSFSPFTDLHFILTFLPACDITLSWLAILNT